MHLATPSSSVFLLLLLLQSSQAQYGGETLERLHFQPSARDIIYTDLTSINTVNYMNVSEVYVRVIECHQMAAALKSEMVSVQISM